MNADEQARFDRLEKVVTILAAHAGPEVAAAIAPYVEEPFALAGEVIDAALAAAEPIVEELTVDIGPPSAAERAAAFAKYDHDARMAAAAAGHALRDGSFVILDHDDLLYATRVAAAEEREDLAGLIAAAEARLADAPGAAVSA